MAPANIVQADGGGPQRIRDEPTPKNLNALSETEIV
jgi:hypothetical protein